MRIEDSFAASNDVRSTEVGRSHEIQQEQKGSQRKTSLRSDSANLSALGAELARALDTDPPDVVSRIEQLEKAVRSGTFQAASSEVAQLLIDDALQGTEADNRSPRALSP